MTHQLNALCNFYLGYLICDIPDNTVEVVVTMKMTFGKYMLVEDLGAKMGEVQAVGEVESTKCQDRHKEEGAPTED